MITEMIRKASKHEISVEFTKKFEMYPVERVERVVGN